MSTDNCMFISFNYKNFATSIGSHRKRSATSAALESAAYRPEDNVSENLPVQKKTETPFSLS